MKITKLMAAVTIISAAITANLFAQGTPSKYTESDLVWQEDFEGKKLNTKDWNYETHEPGWVNNELQSYGNSSKNTFIKDGCLVIQPLKTANKDGTFSFTSGRVNTQGKHTFTYGRFEARIKMPKGKGFLPAFWMMPDNEGFYGQWPKCGEIDIMEILGHEPKKMYGTIHFGEPHTETQGSYTLKNGSFSEDFHVVAVEWEPGEIRYYCDGENYKTINDWYTRKPGFDEVTFPAPFDQPFYIILNVAIGGNWPGYPDKTTGFGEEAQMKVDYIKVYQKKAYNEDVEKPAAPAVTVKTDASGNMISNEESKWKFLKFEGGNADFSAKGGKIDIKPLSDGPVLHAVQVVQGSLALEKGKHYRLSFDASADSERTIVTCISAPERGWIRYLPDSKITLTPNVKHFTFDINMRESTDTEARLEFNCGNQKSLAPVHISNIRLENAGEIKASAEGLNLLPDGNLIHNGQFQEGKGRLANWKIDNKINAEVKVTNDKGRRELMVVSPAGAKAPGDVTVSQNDIFVPAGRQFILRFDAYASKATKITAQFGNFTASPSLSTKVQHFNYLISVPKDGKYNLNLQLADSGSTVFIDNVSLKENSCLLNGNFSSGLAAWELYAHQNAQVTADIEENSGNKEAVISIENTGNLDWMIQLKQTGITLEKGKKYHVSFKAKSDLDRTIMWALQRDGSKDDNWIPYSDTIKYKVNKEYQTFDYTFEMTYTSDEGVIFSISMGAVDGTQIKKAHKIYIDDVVVEETE